MKLAESIKTRGIVWVWNHTPICAEMSRLASRRLGNPPTLKVRLKMWLHFLICVWYERYYKHLRFLHHVALQRPEQLELASGRGRGSKGAAEEPVAVDRSVCVWFVHLNC